MCWNGNKEISPKIAETDIPVFKICTKSYDDKHVESKYLHFTYELGKLYTENVNPCIIFPEGYQIINEAFHSYDIRLEVIYGNMIDEYAGEIVVEGIIPKGATYYLNIFGEIASNQIILKKIKED